MPPVRIPREPQEVHTRHQNGFRWLEEGQGMFAPPGKQRLTRLHSPRIGTILSLGSSKRPPSRQIFDSLPSMPAKSDEPQGSLNWRFAESSAVVSSPTKLSDSDSSVGNEFDCRSRYRRSRKAEVFVNMPGLLPATNLLLSLSAMHS